jgi:hypothetical protein
MVGVEGSLGFEGLFFLEDFGVSVEVAIYFICTGVFLTGRSPLNLDFR